MYQAANNVPFIPSRGILEASIPAASGGGGGTAGIHSGITWTNIFYFQAAGWVTASNLIMYSAIHGGLGSNFTHNNAGLATMGNPAFRGPQVTTLDNIVSSSANTAAKSATTNNEKTIQTDTDANPGVFWESTYGCNKLSFAFAAYSSVATDFFTLRLARALNTADSTSALAGVGAVRQNVVEWGPVKAHGAGDAGINFSDSGFVIPVGTGYWFELQNVSNAASTNTIMGSIYLHA